MSDNGSKVLSLAEILAAKKAEPRKVPFGDGYVLVKTGSMADKAAVEREGQTSAGRMHPYKTRKALLMRALVNEDGSRLLGSDEDAKKFMALDAPLLEPVIDAAFESFGFTKADMEEIEKN